MELVDLGHLPFVVETGSVSSGAQSLGMKPSTISKRIMRLEDELGVFERGAFGRTPSIGSSQASPRRGDTRWQEGRAFDWARGYRASASHCSLCWLPGAGDTGQSRLPSMGGLKRTIAVMEDRAHFLADRGSRAR